MYKLKLLIIFVFVIKFSFGESNELTISFSKNRGYCNSPFLLSLSCNNSNATIWYTTDCSTPLVNKGKKYNNKFEINTTTIVKAVAYSNNDTSILVSHTYLFPEDIKKQGKKPNGFPETWGGSFVIDADYEMDPEIINSPAYSNKITAALKSLPALCLSMSVDDWFNHKTGNYVGYPNSDETREKPVSAEFIYSDSTESFGVNCGVQNQGGTSIVKWKVPKQSMRLLFKEEYGPKKLKKKLFPDSDIKSINTLVADAFLYGWHHNFDKKQRITSLFFRDQLCSNMQNNMGGVSFHGIYVNLYINGLYWGLYDLHERPDEDFMEEYYDEDKSNFDVIKHNPNTVVAGSNASYLDLLKFVRKGISSLDPLSEIKKYLDLPAFIDYMILNFYLGNYDWAHQNYYAATNINDNSGFRFYTWDAEHVMRYSDLNYDATTKKDKGGPTEIHSYLKKNREYRQMFIDAFYKHAFNNGALSIENFEKQFLKLKNEIDLAVILESARWGDYRESIDNVTYTRNDHWIPEVQKVLNEYIPNRRDVVIKQLQRNDNLLYNDIVPPTFNTQSSFIEKGASIEIKNLNSTESNIIYTTDGRDPRKTGGSAQGEQYDSELSIQDDTWIKARIQNKKNNDWSPLVEMIYLIERNQKDIAIAEIMYNLGDNDIEYIELTNSGETTINLLGMKFTDGIDYLFESKYLLDPGNSIILTNNKINFKNLYHFDANDEYNKRLSNSGETVILKDFYGNTIDSVSYLDENPWPLTADGSGFSLELKDYNLDNSIASSWKASDELYGNPQRYKTNVNLIAKPNVENVHLYPNPFNNLLCIDINNQTTDTKEIIIEIYDTYSRLSYKSKIAIDSKQYINLSNLKAGIYYLRIKDSKGKVLSEAKKLIKLF